MKLLLEEKVWGFFVKFLDFAYCGFGKALCVTLLLPKWVSVLLNLATLLSMKSALVVGELVVVFLLHVFQKFRHKRFIPLFFLFL